MNFFEKIFLKTLKRKEYQELKIKKKFLEKNSFFAEKSGTFLIREMSESSSLFGFKHSGNAGDIIYSLPTIYSLIGNGYANIFLQLNQKASYGEIRGEHPLKGVMFNENMFRMLKPLLLAQHKINSCEVFNNQFVDYDLDLFRDLPICFGRGHIARWYFLVFPAAVDLSKPWLSVSPNTDFSEYIVLARSSGYHSPGIDYSFLSKYKKIVCIGVESEYQELRCSIPNLDYYKVNDFLEMAQAIAGSKFFIGNQSFPFSIAEALKVKRVLEQCYACPNVVIEGGNGYEFCFQNQFETIVELLFNQ